MQFYSFFVKIPKSLVFKASCPQRIAISSTGPAKNWNERLGNYKLLRYDDYDNAVYEHEDHEGHYLSKPKGLQQFWIVSCFI